jgi:DNA-directed RNA polymerase subunit RPC12/RpoP
MIQTFQCPNCRASLDYETESHDLTIKCAYCNSSIIVPENLRREGKPKPMAAGAFQQQSQQLSEVMQLVEGDRKIEAIKLFRETFNVSLKEAKDIVDAIERNEAVHLGQIGVSHGTPFVLSQANQQPQSGGSRWVGCFIVSLILTLGLGFGLPLLLGGAATWWGIQEVERAFEGTNVNPLPALNIEQTIEASLAPLDGLLATPEAVDTPDEPGLLSPLLSFGSEGMGPGLFDDTRAIGVDGEGNIYTGDYSGGRIQAFDSNGRYLREWNAGENLYMMRMVVDANGIVYIDYRNELLRFDGRTGEQLASLSLPQGVGPQALAALPGGGLLVHVFNGFVWYGVEGELIRQGGNVPQFTFGSGYQRMVVNQAGEIFLSGRDAILHFNAEGEFLNQIAARGEGLDQMPREPTGMALDNQGRLFLMPTSREIWVFDRNGRHLQTVTQQTMAFYMVINNQNQLLIMNRNAAQVQIYQIND